MLARPLSGFAETFSQYVVELEPGGSGDGEPDEGVQGVLFVLKGSLQLTHEGTHEMSEGGFAYIPPGAQWTCSSAEGASFVWIRKRYEPAPGYDKPDFLVTSDQATERQPMPDTDGAWCTTRFVDPADLRHDMHVTADVQAGRLYSVRGNPCDGARPVHLGGQGRLQPEPGLGRGRGGRLPVVAGLLPAGVLCRWSFGFSIFIRT